jgi:hypothetical protein
MGQDDPPVFKFTSSDSTGLVADASVTSVTELERWINESHEKAKGFTLELNSSYTSAISIAKLDVEDGYGGPLGSMSLASESADFVRDTQRDFKAVIASHNRWRWHLFVGSASKRTWSLILLFSAAIVAALIVGAHKRSISKRHDPGVFCALGFRPVAMLTKKY